MTPYLIYCLEIWGNASDIHLRPLITTPKKLLELLLFRHTALIQIFYLNISMSFPSKKLLFLRIGLQMFKYEYGQLPDALNMFFLLRIDMCIITILETRTNSALLLLSIYTRAPIYRAMKAFCIHTRTHSKPADLWCRDGLKEAHFWIRLLSIHMWNNILYGIML